VAQIGTFFADFKGSPEIFSLLTGNPAQQPRVCPGY
jgi:hypothetical protein